MGAKKVTVVCLEEGEYVPAHDWEKQEAADEGVQLIESYSPKLNDESFSKVGVIMVQRVAMIIAYNYMYKTDVVNIVI